MQLGIRRATAADAGAVARIYVESWNEGFGDLMGVRILDDEIVGRWARDLTTAPRRWCVAERGGRVVGFVGIGPSRDPVQPGLGELDTIAVAPSEWRTGIGRALMSTALDALTEEFSEAIVWTVAGYPAGTSSTKRPAGRLTAGRAPKAGRCPSGGVSEIINFDEGPGGPRAQP